MTFDDVFKKHSKHPNFSALSWTRRKNHSNGYLHTHERVNGETCRSFTSLEEAFSLSIEDRPPEPHEERFVKS